MRLAAKHGNVTNAYCVIKLHQIESYPFDLAQQIDSVGRIDFSQL